MSKWQRARLLANAEQLWSCLAFLPIGQTVYELRLDPDPTRLCRVYRVHTDLLRPQLIKNHLYKSRSIFIAAKPCGIPFVIVAQLRALNGLLQSAEPGMQSSAFHNLSCNECRGAADSIEKVYRSLTSSDFSRATSWENPPRILLP